MDSKWCSTCTDSRPITSFLKDPTDQSSRVLPTCSACRVHKKRNRDASRELDASIPPRERPARRPKRTNQGKVLLQLQYQPLRRRATGHSLRKQYNVRCSTPPSTRL